ncbi:hypothetical protein AS156_36170 [Bradyrhizobium macuxiense]|uniref:Pycsar effector protein domain-containing protein n=1 Tax=Bradyrhizobium macuxiense TaxID=1755647 RepID=A0A120FQA5_9BRAD|nr:hypothetical protein [Bradyrhizobium macuxiense]KWV58234.1 hypothetical protein AS156_36170 [Bradyrhizobium macuxiense]
MFGISKPPSDTGFAELSAKLDGWSIPTDALDRVHDGAKASLAEVKALTEYEDGKASRLLTIVAFLSAVVAAVFTRFAADYPWPGFGAFGTDPFSALTIATYAAFFAYVLLVTGSVLIILWAVKPRFRIPKTWKAGSKPDRPTSMLFYKGILDVTAPTWGEAFIALGTKEGADLKAYYAKCYIAESYLVAEKVADKLRLLKPGVGVLQAAMWVLLGFFLLAGANVIMVKSSSSAAPKATPSTAPAVNPPAPVPAPGKKGG